MSWCPAYVTFADVNSTYEELLDIFREDKFTGFLFLKILPTMLLVLINMKDLLLYDNTKEFHIRDILREAYFTYEYKSISELLVEMRQASFNIAIVLDEYGETAGPDNAGRYPGKRSSARFMMDMSEDEDFVQEVSGAYIYRMNLDDLNDRLDLDLNSEEYDSLGGFIIEEAGPSARGGRAS